MEKSRKDVRIMNKNRKIKRGLTTSLAVGMSVMMGAVPVFAAGTSSDADAVYKEETVYVNADATGTNDEVTVSNWQKKSGSVSGSLTDNYNPRNKTLNLSDSVYNSTSVAAIGVAAHETGHAIQHAYGYGPLSFRTALFPLASVGSQVSWILIVLGLIFGSTNILIDIGILMFGLAVLFQLVTLPVEFNASARALQLLESEGFLYGDENRQARKVLSAAAMTYVAAAATAILQLLRLIYLFGGRRRD